MYNVHVYSAVAVCLSVAFPSVEFRHVTMRDGIGRFQGVRHCEFLQASRIPNIKLINQPLIKVFIPDPKFALPIGKKVIFPVPRYAWEARGKKANKKSNPIEISHASVTENTWIFKILFKCSSFYQ